MKVEITYIPQGQKNVVIEQYETDFTYPNFYIKGLLSNRPCLSFFSIEKIDGKFTTVHREIYSDSTIILQIIEL